MRPHLKSMNTLKHQGNWVMGSTWEKNTHTKTVRVRDICTFYGIFSVSEWH